LYILQVPVFLKLVKVKIKKAGGMAVMALNKALDPLLCVLSFRAVCLYHALVIFV
jgi:hypothetical protein